MFRQTFRLFTAIPVTWSILFVSGMLWTLDIGISRRWQIDFHQAQLLLGAESEFGLWDGAWWTVITTSFHHGGVIHLFSNVVILWMLGRLLETRLGSWRYALFCLLGTIVSGGIQSLVNPYVGISGMLCAQLGFIWTWRKTDTWLQTYAPPEMAPILVGSLFLCLPLEWFNILPIANTAHFAGLFYGCLWGVVYREPLKARLLTTLFVLSHAALLPLLYFASHPVWNGRYFAHLADQAKHPRVRQALLESAVRRNPHLDSAWLNLALLATREGEYLKAWDYLLGCLKYSPSYQPAISLSRQVWKHLKPGIERNVARQHVRQVFGENSRWEDRLLPPNISEQLIPLERIMGVLDKIRRGPPAESSSAAPPIALPQHTLEDIPRQDQKLPVPDPNAPGSAEEGQAT